MENQDKVKIEKGGKTEEVSKEKLQEMQSNPDFLVEKKETKEGDTYKVKERLLG